VFSRDDISRPRSSCGRYVGIWRSPLAITISPHAVGSWPHGGPRHPVPVGAGPCRQAGARGPTSSAADYRVLAGGRNGVSRLGIAGSLKQPALCVVDSDGQVVREAKLITDPEVVRRSLTEKNLICKRIGLEGAGPLLGSVPPFRGSGRATAAAAKRSPGTSVRDRLEGTDASLGAIPAFDGMG
jgi:hypothetical protein